MTSPSTTDASGTRTLAINLPPIALSAGRAREFVQRTLQIFGLPDDGLADRLCLIASELVTNAVLHAGTDLELRLSCQPPDVILEVSDGAALLAHPNLPLPLATHGRGLVLVDALADSWGMSRTDQGRGKRVWVRLRVT